VKKRDRIIIMWLWKFSVSVSVFVSVCMSVCFSLALLLPSIYTDDPVYMSGNTTSYVIVVPVLL